MEIRNDRKNKVVQWKRIRARIVTKKQRYQPDYYDGRFRSTCCRLELQREAYGVPPIDRYESQR